MGFADALQRRVFFKPGNQINALQRSHYRHAVFEIIDGTIRTFVETFHRGVRIKRHHERYAERARLREVGDMTAMQDVKNAVGKHQGAR